MANRTATSVLFGFDFQANAAIVLMLENIKDMTSIRLEGAEDIEINLNDGSCVLAQAKAVVNSSTDFSNALSNLKKSITSLSEAEYKSGLVKELIYITNTPNPLKEKQLNPIFYGVAQRDYCSLPEPLKDKINKIISKIEKPLDTSKFKIQILPFETDNDNERYKCVMDAIGDFIPKLGNISIAKDKLHGIWIKDIFRSGTKRTSDIKLTKKDIIWPLIVLVTQNENYDEDDFDDSEIYELSRSYEAIINTCSEKYEFVTKVLCAYNSFHKEAKQGERKQKFTETESCKFAYIFEGESVFLPSTLQEKLLQIIVRNILNKRIQIDNIKNAVNL